MTNAPPEFPIEVFDALERRRKGDLWFASGCTTLAFLFISGVVSIFLNPFVNPAGWAVIGLFTLVLGVSIFQIFNTAYRKKLKQQFLQEMARQFGLSYSLPGAFVLSQVADHRIIPSYDTCVIEDGFSGHLKHVPFEMQEVLLENIYEDKDGKETRTTIFRGLMIRLGLKKNLEFHTVAIPRSRIKTWLATTPFSKLSGYDRIGLPPKFEEKYDVLSTHQIESRVIFDPAFMERFLELLEHLKAKSLSASFQQDELLIILDYGHKNHFEVGHLFRALDDRDIFPVLEELKTFTAIVDILKLNPYTGL